MDSLRKKGVMINMMKKIRVAVCGNLPTACDYLLSLGVVQIEWYIDATEIPEKNDYDLFLIYAPQAEGLLNTQLISGSADGLRKYPIRLLNEPCCHSALVELKSTIRQIEKTLLQAGSASDSVLSTKGTV